MEKILPITLVYPRSPFNDLSKLPLINPITYELINEDVWVDGLYIYPYTFIDDGIYLVVEIKDKKVINAYKNC